MTFSSALRAARRGPDQPRRTLPPDQRAGTRDPDPVDCSPDIMRGLPVFRGRRGAGNLPLFRKVDMLYASA